MAEADLLARPGTARPLLDALRRQGFRFALRGVGLGGKSLEYLKDLPLDHLCIDADLCRSCDDEPMNLALVKTLNDVAHHLGVCSRALGVGSGNALKTLQTLGVDYAQGHYIAAPSPEISEHHAASMVPILSASHRNGHASTSTSARSALNHIATETALRVVPDFSAPDPVSPYTAARNPGHIGEVAACPAGVKKLMLPNLSQSQTSRAPASK